MERIDRRIHYRLVIDTETFPIDKNVEKVDPLNMWVYNVAWAVVDKRGNVYETMSFLNKDIFYGERDLVQSAYYANKIPLYEEWLAKGEIELASFYWIRKCLKETIEKYNIAEIYAHNMRFDYHTLNVTQRWLTKSKYRYFFPYGTEICDTLKMARDVIAPMPSYRRFCEEHGNLTKTGRLKTSAEALYQFITKDPNFVESHTALEDVLIEKEILAYCYRQHKKMSKKLW